MRFAPLIGVVALTVSCGDARQDAGHDPPPPSASAVSPVDPIEQCIAARKAGFAMVHADPAAATRKALTGCAAMYKKPECRDGHIAAAEAQVSEADRIRMFTEPCVRAYCPDLPAPKPAMCSMSPDEVRPLPMAKKRAAWAELHSAILEHDHGPEAVARLKAAETPPDARPRVRVRRAGGALLVSIIEGSKMRAFPMDDGSEQALTKALGELDAANGVVLEVGAGTAREEISRVASAMKAAGITRIEEVEIEPPAP